MTTSIPGLQHDQDWKGSQIEGTKMGKQGREAHLKIKAWLSSTNQLTFHLCGTPPQILIFGFFGVPFHSPYEK